MESALCGIFTLVGFVSEISLVRGAHSFDFRYFTNSCENPVRTRFPWSNLYISNTKLEKGNHYYIQTRHKDPDLFSHYNLILRKLQEKKSRKALENTNEICSYPLDIL